MPIPRIDWLKILLPIILKTMPECLQAEKITRGRIIPINNVNPMNDAQEVRNLSRKFERKPRQDGRKDSSFVVRLDDAIKCIEDSAGKGGLVAKVVRKCMAALISGGTGSGPNVTEDLLDPVIACLREHALKQTASRVRETVRYSKREK